MLRRLVSVLAAVCFILPLFQIKSNASAPEKDAEAFVVINAETLSVLDGKEIHKRLPMASTTKIMTAIVLCESVEDLQKTVVTTKEMVTVEGSSMGLLEGDTVSFEALLYGLLLSSGNDAANTIAISLCGSIEAFVAKMNAKAKELGLKDTSFETPSGLDGEHHYTSAYDLSIISAYALKIPEIAKAVSSKEAVLFYGNPPYRRRITNHNKLIGNYPGAIGVKTGFTQKSGRCLVSAVQREGATLIVVTLNAANDYENHKFLYDRNFKKLKLTELSVDGSFETYLTDGSLIPLEFNPPAKMLEAGDMEKITHKVYLPRFVYAPVKEGQKIGWVDYYYDGYKFASADITSAFGAEFPPKKPKSFIKRIFELFTVMLKC